MRVLLIEDDPTLGPSIKQGLELTNYAVDLLTDGADGLQMALTFPYDVVILDVMLPGMQGFEVCRKIRDAGHRVPILMLTALSSIDQRVAGLDSGADDYLVKPFANAELLARVRALLRREAPSKAPELHFLDITLDPRTREVRRGKRVVDLSAKEYALLELLLRHPRQVLTRSMIADHVWNYDADNISNVIDVYIRYLRRKLCEGGEADLIHTVRGAGYQLKEPSL